MQLQQPLGLYVRAGHLCVGCGRAEGLPVQRAGKAFADLYPAGQPLYDSTIPFRVTRLLADSAGNLYALVEGQYSGAVLFSAAGEFLGFTAPTRWK